MANFQEEVYIIEKREISEDEGEDEEFEKLRQEEEEDFAVLSEDDEEESEDDLNDFATFKRKTEQKLAKKARETGVTSHEDFETELKPKVIERDVVIDDYLRNFLTSMGMAKTLNIF